MRLSSIGTPVVLLTLLSCVLLTIASCTDNSTGTRQPRDLTTLPDGWETPWDTTSASVDSTFTITVDEDQVKVYIHRRPEDGFEVNERDQVTLYYTGWRASDVTVFATSWANSSTIPSSYSDLSYSSSLVEGFRLGVLGMREGERRTVVIPPALGYGNATQGSSGFDLRNDTLIYNLELASIAN